MTNPAVTLTPSDADIRWRNWQARGAEGDRRTAARMRTLMLVIVAALVVAFLVQLT
jgi:hypothetical protein